MRRSGGTFLDSHVWRPELGSRALVVSKDDFDDRRWVQLPAGFGFHHGNGWEEADGTVRFDHCVAADPGFVDDALRRVMQGRLTPAAPSRYTEFVLHPDGRADVREQDAVAEFPRVAPAMVGRRNRFVYTLGGGRQPDWVPGSLEKRDLETGDVDRFAYGRDVFPEEHVFVPFPDGKAEDDGWLVGTFLAHELGQDGDNRLRRQARVRRSRGAGLAALPAAARFPRPVQPRVTARRGAGSLPAPRGNPAGVSARVASLQLVAKRADLGAQRRQFPGDRASASPGRAAVPRRTRASWPGASASNRR